MMIPVRASSKFSNAARKPSAVPSRPEPASRMAMPTSNVETERIIDVCGKPGEPDVREERNAGACARTRPRLHHARRRLARPADPAAGGAGHDLDPDADLASQFFHVGDDPDAATLCAEVEQGPHGEVQRLRVEAAKALVDEQGFQPPAA